MTAQYSNRYEVCDAILTQLRNALPGIQVEYGFPGDQVEKNAIWVGHVSGSEDIATHRAGRVDVDDKFTVALIFQAVGTDSTMRDAAQRVQSFYQAFQNLYMTDITWGSVTGLVMTGTSFKTDGPSAHMTAEGPVAYMTTSFDCQSRYTSQ